MGYMNATTNSIEHETCDRTNCNEDAIGEDRHGVPVCQAHAEDDWAKD